jgi:hypothetical protein
MRDSWSVGRRRDEARGRGKHGADGRNSLSLADWRLSGARSASSSPRVTAAVRAAGADDFRQRSGSLMWSEDEVRQLYVCSERPTRPRPVARDRVRGSSGDNPTPRLVLRTQRFARADGDPSGERSQEVHARLSSSALKRNAHAPASTLFSRRCWTTTSRLETGAGTSSVTTHASRCSIRDRHRIAGEALAVKVVG